MRYFAIWKQKRTCGQNQLQKHHRILDFELGVPWVAENKAAAPRALFVKRFYGEFEEIQSKYDPSITANIVAVKSRVCSIFEFQRHPTIGDAVTRNFENGRGIQRLFATTQSDDDAYTCRSTRIVRLVSKFDEKHHHRVSNFTFLKENPPFQTQ